jgi:hypothetical protein
MKLAGKIVAAKHKLVFGTVALGLLFTGGLLKAVRAQDRDDSQCRQYDSRCEKQRERERRERERERGREERERARYRDNQDRYRDRDGNGGSDNAGYHDDHYNRGLGISIRIEQRIAGDFPDHAYSDAQRIAQENGHRTGLEKGLDDGRHSRSFNPERSSHYRDGDAGYHKEYGLKEDYRIAYRQAFVNGYTEGFREYNRHEYVSRW